MARKRIKQVINTENWNKRVTTRRCPIGATPFSLAFGMETVIPTEVGMPVLCIVQHLQENQEIEGSLDWADELRKTTLIWMEAYHHQAMAYNNKWAKQRSLQPRYLVLRRMFENMAESVAGKLHEIKLGRSIQSNRSRTRRGTPSWKIERETHTLALECLEFEKVLFIASLLWIKFFFSYYEEHSMKLELWKKETSALHPLLSLDRK